MRKICTSLKFRKQHVNIPKITILLYNGYPEGKIGGRVEKIYPQIITKIRFKLSPKPSTTQKDKDVEQVLFQSNLGGLLK